MFFVDAHNFRLNKAHTGEYLAAKLVKSLKDYAIEKKVTGVPPCIVRALG